MDNLRFIVMTVPGKRNIDHLLTSIPGLILAEDTTRNATDTFRKALVATDGHPAIIMEDDVVLCDDFVSRAVSEIDQRELSVIQFFSRRQYDISLGSRYISGRQFSCTVCYYLPAFIGMAIYNYSRNPKIGAWRGRTVDPTGYDLIIADYLGNNKLKYWNVVPNLVDHASGESLINSRRSGNRHSLSFVPSI